MNGKLVPLDYNVQTGDRLEILTAKKPSPSRDWLNPRLGYVGTRQARQKIAQWFRKKEREEQVARGREALDRELKRSGIKEKNYDTMARLFKLGGSKDLFEAVACGTISAHQVAVRMTQAGQTEGERPEPIFPTLAAPGPVGVLVKGEKGLLTRQAQCCRPLPGEKVIGYITRGRGVSIHRSDCHNVALQKGSPCLVEVDWGKEGQRSLSSLKIVGIMQKVWLKDFASIVEDENAAISSLNVAENRETALMTVNAILEIENIAQLNRIIHKTRKLASVIEAGR